MTPSEDRICLCDLVDELADTRLFQGFYTTDFFLAFRLFAEEEATPQDVVTFMMKRTEAERQILRENMDSDQETRFVLSFFPKLHNYVRTLLSSPRHDGEEWGFARQCIDGRRSFEDAVLELGLQVALVKVHSFQQYRTMLGAMTVPAFPAAVKHLLHERDLLIEVTGSELIEDGFTLHRTDLVLVPCFSNGLDRRFAICFEKMLAQARVYVSPAEFHRKQDSLGLSISLEEHIYGKPFNGDTLRHAVGKFHGSYEYVFRDPEEESIAALHLVPLKALQYVIRELRQGEVSLSIEEVIDVEKQSWRQAEYYIAEDGKDLCVKQTLLHAIIRQEDLAVRHLDCSWLLYDFDAYAERAESHLKDKVVSATQKRKIFRLDGDIPLDVLKLLAMGVFRCEHNPEIGRFLRGEVGLEAGGMTGPSALDDTELLLETHLQYCEKGIVLGSDLAN